MCPSELEAISEGKKFIDEIEIKKKDLKFQKGTDILEQILELKKFKNEIEKEVIKTDFSSLIKKVIYYNLKEINLKTKKLNKKFKELTGVEFL
jgi:glutamyl/glutaminyl-tRNA synthetase